MHFLPGGSFRATTPRLGFLGSVLLVASCGLDSTAPAQLPTTTEGGARHLELAGRLVQLGATDPEAAPEERPGWVRFVHDIWMDTTEVTQAEFRSLLGRNPSASQGDGLPVTNVSWFDAVQAANARSRRDGYDTVYEYTAVQQDSAGNASGLGGLSIHLDRKGWRLPTEAEWEFAARGNTSTAYSWGALADSMSANSYAWYQKNSDGRIHPVATKSPNGWGLYDMAGNAMEWVDDWKGAFPKDTVVDYAGPEAPGDVPETALKGGAYPYGLSHLRPSSRSATYAAYRSSRAEYVGFRLVRGGFRPTWGNGSGQNVSAPPVTISVSDLPRLLGSTTARLVFLNRVDGKGILSWVDFSEATPTVRSLPDRDPVFHPVISPDGQWVAWCTALEGSTGPSEIKARRLAKNDTMVLDLGPGAIPRWWVNGADTFLVRAWALDNTDPAWSSTKTTAQRWSNGTLTGTVGTWAASGSYHDGRSGAYLYTGYRRLKQLDTRSGSSRVLFTAPSNGKASGDTSQVCNVSSAPDSSGRTMFLDFGYSGTSTVVGRPYGIHEIAFVADSNGNVLRQIPSPIKERQWEHLEWSNSARWAVSGAIDGTGAYKDLYVVDLQTTEATRIANGQELWQPALWVGPTRPVVLPGAADPDSAVQYYSPIETPEMDGFGDNLSRFWVRKDSADVVLVGSSHFLGMVPSHFPNHTMLNLSMAASSISDWDLILRRIVLPDAPKVKVVVMTLMPGWFFPTGSWIGHRWTAAISPTTGIKYDSAHGFWKDGLPPGFVEAARAQLLKRSTAVVIPDVDYVGGGWGGTSPDLDPTPTEDSTLPEFTRNMAVMDSLAELLGQRGIHLLLVNCPQSPAYRSTIYAGRYGPTWPMYHAILARFRGLETRNRHFHFYDAHQDGNHGYAEDEAANCDHLAIRGSRKLGHRLDSILTVIAP